MKSTIEDIYKGWTTLITAADNKCAHFSFGITSPAGYTQHVPMGGINDQRAMERAREMIDMEIALSDDD